MIDHGNYQTITIKEFVDGDYRRKDSEKSGGSSVKAGEQAAGGTLSSEGRDWGAMDEFVENFHRYK